jgi:hypothetical protein
LWLFLAVENGFFWGFQAPDTKSAYFFSPASLLKADSIADGAAACGARPCPAL